MGQEESGDAIPRSSRRRRFLAGAALGGAALAAHAAGAPERSTGQDTGSTRSGTVELTRQGAIALITFNRPAQDNVLDQADLDALVEVWRTYKTDDTLRVAIVTGKGGQAFCGGIDTSFVNRSAGPLPPPRDEGLRAYTSKQNKCWKPVIAAIDGFVAGPGLHFVLDADIAIATPEASFFDIHMHRTGSVPVFEPIEMARRLPYETVARFFLLGPNDPWTADRALALGLISEVVPRAGLMARAINMARQIAALDPSLVSATLESLYKSRELGVRDAIERGLIIRQITGYRAAPMASIPLRDLARPKAS